LRKAIGRVITAAMTDQVIIAQAEPGDAAEIAAIYAHYVLHGVATFEIEEPDVAEMVERMNQNWDDAHTWLVARDPAGEMVGYAYTSTFHDRDAYAFTCEDSIYLRHDRRREGIGTILLGAVIKEAERMGYRQMIAQIVASEAGSVALHQRFGFAEVGRMTSVGRKQGRWLDVITMQRALGVGDTAPPPEEP
jgi:phosphinothricin acetyltransferase